MNFWWSSYDSTCLLAIKPKAEAILFAKIKPFFKKKKKKRLLKNGGGWGSMDITLPVLKYGLEVVVPG